LDHSLEKGYWPKPIPNSFHPVPNPYAHVQPSYHHFPTPYPHLTPIYTQDTTQPPCQTHTQPPQYIRKQNHVSSPPYDSPASAEYLHRSIFPPSLPLPVPSSHWTAPWPLQVSRPIQYIVTPITQNQTMFIIIRKNTI
jgi:hypothetical protein